MGLTKPAVGEFYEQFVINEEPSSFVARLAMVVGKKGYVLTSQTDQTAIFNLEETKFVGIARGGTKKYVSTVTAQFSAPNDAGERTAAVQGDDGWLLPEIRQAIEPEVKTCPDCAETILAEARVCKHCGFRPAAEARYGGC